MFGTSTIEKNVRLIQLLGGEALKVRIDVMPIEFVIGRPEKAVEGYHHEQRNLPRAHEWIKNP
jgi:hypothetical protein